MKVITTSRNQTFIALTRLRKRIFLWPYSVQVGIPVTKGTLATLSVPAIIPAVGVDGHGLLEMDAGEFTYTSQDNYLTLTNTEAITALVTTKGTGAGTVVTEVPPVLKGLVSVEKVS